MHPIALAAWAYRIDHHAITVLALYTRTHSSPPVGARLRLKELLMPDLDLIKQAEQGARDRRGRFVRGRSGNPASRPRGCRDHVNRAARRRRAARRIPASTAGSASSAARPMQNKAWWLLGSRTRSAPGRKYATSPWSVGSRRTAVAGQPAFFSIATADGAAGVRGMWWL